jgi:hypothetical protein
MAIYLVKNNYFFWGPDVLQLFFFFPFIFQGEEKEKRKNLASKRLLFEPFIYLFS